MTDALRQQLLDGLPARVQGMAEAILDEWADAVEAVPSLARLATDDLLALMRMPAPERERELRRRWAAAHDQLATELTGRRQRRFARASAAWPR